MTENFNNALNISHSIMKNNIKQGNNVIDATMGKGRDTLFLSCLAGESGKVYSFDIQECAVKYTKSFLNSNPHPDNVSLINDGHENMKKYVDTPINAVMFNLGYLPGGAHNITTKVNTTIEAVKQAMELIIPGGIISICVYYGHKEGNNEKKELLSFCKDIDNKLFSVSKLEFINQANQPPCLIIIQKIKNIV